MSSSYQARGYQRPEEEQPDSNVAELIGTGLLAGAGLGSIAGIRLGRGRIARGVSPKKKEAIRKLAELNKKPAANAGVRQKDLNTPSTLEELSTRINKDLDALNEYAKTDPELASFLDKAYKETDFAVTPPSKTVVKQLPASPTVNRPNTFIDDYVRDITEQRIGEQQVDDALQAFNLTGEARSERARQYANVRRVQAAAADDIIDGLRREATVDQAATATNSGANQEIGRVKHRLQQNEDVNLSKIEMAEDLADTAIQQQVQNNNIPLTETPNRDAGINLVSSQSVDGLPVDQAEIVATGQGSVQGKQILENAGLPSGSSSVEQLSIPNVATGPVDAQQFVTEQLGETIRYTTPAQPAKYPNTASLTADEIALINKRSTGGVPIKITGPSNIQRPGPDVVIEKNKAGDVIGVGDANYFAGQRELPIVYSTQTGTNQQLVRKEFTPQQVERVKNTVRVEKPSSQAEQINLNKLQQEAAENAKQEISSRASDLIAQGLRPGTTRFDNALAAGMVGRSDLRPSSGADRSLGITDAEFQKNVVLSKNLEGALPPSQRLYYEQTSEGQIIPETVEKRQERPVVITEEDTKTLKSAGGRIGSTAQTKSVIGPYGIEREDFPKADITKRPTDTGGKKSFSTQPPAAGDPKESMTMAEEVRKIYNNPNISPEKRAAAAQDFLSSKMGELNISAIGDAKPLRKNPYGGRRRRLR